MKTRMKTFLKLLPEATERNAKIYSTGLKNPISMCFVRDRPCDFRFDSKENPRHGSKRLKKIQETGDAT